MSALESVKCPAAPRTQVHNNRPHILSLNGVNKQSEKLQIQARVRKTKPPALLVSERLRNILHFIKKQISNCSCYREKQICFLIKQPFGHSYNAKWHASRIRSSQQNSHNPHFHTSWKYMYLEIYLILFFHTSQLLKTPPWNPQLIFMTVWKVEGNWRKKEKWKKNINPKSHSQTMVTICPIWELMVSRSAFIFRKAV